MRSGFLVLFLIVCVSFVFSQDAKPFNYQGWDLIKNEQLVVAFKLPAGWKSEVSKEADQIIYFKCEKPDLPISDSTAKVLTVESFGTSDTFEKICEHRINSVKNREGGKIFIEATDGKIGNLKTKVIHYASRIDGTQRTSENVIVVNQNRLWAITYTVTNEFVNHDKDLKNQILASFDFEMMKPSLVMHAQKPKDWFEFKDVDYKYSFCRKNNDGKGANDGIIQAKIIKAEADKSLQQFASEFISSIAPEGKKTSSFATVPSLNGRAMLWFDIEDKENTFTERFHIIKIGYTFYIVRFISGKEIFEKELKPVLADFLMAIKFGDTK